MEKIGQSWMLRGELLYAPKFTRVRSGEARHVVLLFQ